MKKLFWLVLVYMLKAVPVRKKACVLLMDIVLVHMLRTVPHMWKGLYSDGHCFSTHAKNSNICEKACISMDIVLGHMLRTVTYV